VKTIPKISLLLGLCGPVAALAQSTAPQIPLGELSVNKNLLRIGASPTLTWSASYPQPVTEVVTVNPDDSLTTKKKVELTVRVLGVAFQSGSLQLPTKLSVRFNNGSWSTRFLGATGDVRPDVPVYTGVVNANTRVDFEFRGASDNKKNNAKTNRESDWNWGYAPVATTSESQKKIALTDGQATPDYAPAYNQKNIKSHLSSVLSADGQSVSIGPRDVIYLSELSSAAPNTTYFDMQDLVLLVTMKEVP
jgi:hypothetical protein